MWVERRQQPRAAHLYPAEFARGLQGALHVRTPTHRTRTHLEINHVACTPHHVGRGNSLCQSGLEPRRWWMSIFCSVCARPMTNHHSFRQKLSSNVRKTREVDALLPHGPTHTPIPAVRAPMMKAASKHGIHFEYCWKCVRWRRTCRPAAPPPPASPVARTWPQTATFAQESRD